MKAVDHSEHVIDKGYTPHQSMDITRVSIAEARRIMGESSDSMSDAEVEKTIYDLTSIARSYVRSVGSKSI